MLLEGDSPVIQKLNGIHEAGTAALRAGTVEPFTGYPKSLKNRFGVYFRYTGESEQLLRERVLDEIAEIGQDLGIGFFVAGRPAPEGHPIHTSVLESLYQEREGNLEGLFIAIISELGLIQMPIVDLKFDTVLVDKGPVILAATQIPQEIIDIRGEVSDKYTKSGLKPLSLDNLFHLTLARMTKVVDVSHADEYIERMEDLHNKVAEKPLILQARGFQRTSAFDMLTGI